MTRYALYCDKEPFVCDWTAGLIMDGLIPGGDVLCKSIREITPKDLAGYTRVHFFSGIAGWAYALALAEWPEDREVWTGSCPCQPFSVAGKRTGVSDVRHLWPEFRRLIAECRPATVFGEQVASKDGREWLSGVRADLEALGYAVGAADLCAAGVGAPHIRQRLHWVADTKCDARNTRGTTKQSTESDGTTPTGSCIEPGRCGDISGLGDNNDTRLERRGLRRGECSNQFAPWSASTFIPCRDGKYRRVPANSEGDFEPSLFPLADGVSNRVGILRGAGNSIVPQSAAKFIKCFLEVENGA